MTSPAPVARHQPSASLSLGSDDVSIALRLAERQRKAELNRMRRRLHAINIPLNARTGNEPEKWTPLPSETLAMPSKSTSSSGGVFFPSKDHAGSRSSTRGPVRLAPSGPLMQLRRLLDSHAAIITQDPGKHELSSGRSRFLRSYFSSGGPKWHSSMLTRPSTSHKGRVSSLFCKFTEFSLIFLFVVGFIRRGRTLSASVSSPSTTAAEFSLSGTRPTTSTTAEFSLSGTCPATSEAADFSLSGTRPTTSASTFEISSPQFFGEAASYNRTNLGESVFSSSSILSSQSMDLDRFRRDQIGSALMEVSTASGGDPLLCRSI